MDRLAPYRWAEKISRLTLRHSPLRRGYQGNTGADRLQPANSAETLVAQLDQVVQVGADPMQFLQRHTEVLEVLALLKGIIDISLGELGSEPHLQALSELAYFFA